MYVPVVSVVPVVLVVPLAAPPATNKAASALAITPTSLFCIFSPFWFCRGAEFTTGRTDGRPGSGARAASGTRSPRGRQGARRLAVARRRPHQNRPLVGVAERVAAQHVAREGVLLEHQ